MSGWRWGLPGVVPSPELSKNCLGRLLVSISEAPPASKNLLLGDLKSEGLGESRGLLGDSGPFRGEPRILLEFSSIFLGEHRMSTVVGGGLLVEVAQGDGGLSISVLFFSLMALFFHLVTSACRLDTKLTRNMRYFFFLISSSSKQPSNLLRYLSSWVIFRWSCLTSSSSLFFSSRMLLWTTWPLGFTSLAWRTSPSRTDDTTTVQKLEVRKSLQTTTRSWVLQDSSPRRWDLLRSSFSLLRESSLMLNSEFIFWILKKNTKKTSQRLQTRAESRNRAVTMSLTLVCVLLTLKWASPQFGTTSFSDSPDLLQQEMLFSVGRTAEIHF